jgi:stage V sporulation protein G
MRVTQVRIKLSPPHSTDRLRGFCTITLDGEFAVKDIKIIDGPEGIFVAMPSRKITTPCPQCRQKNHLKARFYNGCGTELAPTNGDFRSHEDGPKLHADIAHPISRECRAMVQEAITNAYQEELARSKQPGYAPARFDDAGD